MICLIYLFLPQALAISESARAKLEVLLYENNINGEMETLQYSLDGEFSTAGAFASAEGTVKQVRIGE